MKRKTLIFIGTVFLTILIVPLITIISAPNLDAIKWKEKTFLYNMDFASKWTARTLYFLGISLDPNQMIIGRDGWLYLGDRHEKTLTVDRRIPTEEDILLGHRIGASIKAWDFFLAGKGVKAFVIMIGPNKGTIYPEYMPTWARSATPNTIEILTNESDPLNLIYLKSTLLTAKLNQSDSLYYKTDTHWNYFGAGIAFQMFAQEMHKLAPELRWPSADVYQIKNFAPRGGGDLANFLRLRENLTDFEPIINAQTLPLKTIHYDFNTGQAIYEGANIPIGTPNKPLLVRTEGALNNKKVLWLRDSFGSAMSQLMALTFSDVLEVHNDMKLDARFAQLVEDWKPDYVFVTVVERTFKAVPFTSDPPLKITLPDTKK